MMCDHPYDEQAKYYEQRECELQERIDELEAEIKLLKSRLKFDGAYKALAEKDDDKQ